MGDGADALTEAGIAEWSAHCAGTCDTLDPCPYCHEEARQRRILERQRGGE